MPDMPLFCPRFRKVAYHIDGPKEAVMTRLRCKQWSCVYCRQKNAAIWYMHLKTRLPDVSSEWWLLTLTANELTRSLTESLANIREKIDALMKRIRRVWGHIEYVRVYERHPTSEAVHAHFIISGLTPFVVNGFSVKHRPMAIGVLTRKGRNGIWAIRSWLKINARELHLGYMADVKLIVGDALSPIRYVCKYLFKDQDIDVMYLRHVQVTDGIGSPPALESKEWKTALFLEMRMFEAGTKITDLNTGEIIDNDYWEHDRLYPLD